MYNHYKIKPLHIVLPKTSTYVNSYNEQTKWMYLLIEDYELLEKYKTVWDKIADIKSNLIASMSTIKIFFEN